MDPLDSITPIDGRYREKIHHLKEYFSEYALIKERVKIELDYLVNFIDEVDSSKKHLLPEDWRERVKKIIDSFSIDDVRKIKEIERMIGHDVMAVVKFLMERLKQVGLDILSPYVHLGLTSEDINNLAYSILLKRFNEEVLVPSIMKLVDKLCQISSDNIKTVMMARTHGLPAVPTTFGRYLLNYAYRVSKILEGLVSIKFQGKMGGAIGDHNALKFSYPEIDWIEFSKSFVERQGLRYNPASTQILPHDQVSEYLMKVAIMDSILSNLCRDLWMMSLLGHVSFLPTRGEVHSSTMPHKSNPTLIENSEGALDLASEILSYFSRRLLSSRLHRDLSDSIIKRFYGIPLSLTLIGIQNLIASLERIHINKESMVKEVEEHPEILAEAYQVYLRRHGYGEAYELVQAAVRDHPRELLERLMEAIPDVDLTELSQLKPSKYLGEGEKIAKIILKDIDETMKRLRDRR
ncbi:MAG: lyase family protein [Candidatus Caldarchaeales archaeon]